MLDSPSLDLIKVVLTEGIENSEEAVKNLKTLKRKLGVKMGKEHKALDGS